MQQQQQQSMYTSRCDCSYCRFDDDYDQFFETNATSIELRCFVNQYKHQGNTSNINNYKDGDKAEEDCDRENNYKCADNKRKECYGIGTGIDNGGYIVDAKNTYTDGDNDDDGNEEAIGRVLLKGVVSGSGAARLDNILGHTGSEYARLISTHSLSRMHNKLCRGSSLCAFKLLLQHSNFSIDEVRVSQLTGLVEDWSLQTSRKAKHLPVFDREATQSVPSETLSKINQHRQTQLQKQKRHYEQKQRSKGSGSEVKVRRRV